MIMFLAMYFAFGFALFLTDMIWDAKSEMILDAWDVLFSFCALVLMWPATVLSFVIWFILNRIGGASNADK